MLAKLLIAYNWQLRPRVKGFLFKLLYCNKRIKIGKNFQCDTFPDIFMTGNGQLVIGDNVIFRRNVDIRVHKEAKIILENNVKLDKGVRVLATNTSTILLKEGTGVGCFSVLNGGDSITVGKKVLISGFVYLQTSKHQYKPGEFIRDQGFDHNPVVIEDDVWIGAHTVVLPNCVIRSKAVVGSNAVVVKDIEENSVVGGIPAKPIKIRE